MDKINKNWLLAGLGVGLTWLVLSQEGQEQDTVQGPGKRKAKKSISQKYLTAQRRADETKKNQYLKLGDKSITVRPLSN